MVDRVDRQLFWGCPEIVNTSDFTAVGAVDQQRIARWTGSFFTAARVDVVAVEHLGVLHPAVGGTHVRVAAVGLSLATFGLRDLHALHTCSSSLVATVVSPLATWVEKIPSR